MYPDPPVAAQDWTCVSSKCDDAPLVHKNTLLEHGVQLDTKAQGSVLALLLKETFALGLFLSLSVSLCELVL